MKLHKEEYKLYYNEHSTSNILQYTNYVVEQDIHGKKGKIGYKLVS
jgi:hypothetical protein